MSQTIAFCGLDCAECPAYKAHQTQDSALRQKTAREWTELYHFPCTPEMIDCVGCVKTDGAHIGHCAECAVRTCGLAKGVAHCGACPEFDACPTIGDFLAKVPVAKANMEAIRSAGSK